MDLREVAGRQLFDPKTPADRLVEIAERYPDLIPDVMAHPNARALISTLGKWLSGAI